MRILKLIKRYFEKRRHMKEWRKNKVVKWKIEGVSKEEIKKRLRGHRISLKDSFRKSY